MRFKLQDLRGLFSRKIPWEVDFRDASIATKAVCHSVQRIAMIVTSSAFFLLLFWSAYAFTAQQEAQRLCEEIQRFINSNGKRNEDLLKKNTEFCEKRDVLMQLINAYTTTFDPLKFLADLIENKSDKIRFSQVLICNERKSFSSSSDGFQIQLQGFVKNDIDLVETFREEILKYPALSKIKRCKSFFQFDQNQKNFSANEIKFQLTVQPSE